MNRPPVVIHASVAIKLVIIERSTNNARALIDDCLREARGMFAPPHMRGEAANGIYQRLRTADPVKRLDRARVDNALSQFLRYPIQPIDPPALYERALDFAAVHRLPSVYDAL